MAETKQELIKDIIERLHAEQELYFRAARAAHAEATHEQSKAENKYDTRGLEAAYLARGQSKQAAELAESINQYGSLVPRSFASTEPIDVGALVELEMKRERMLYFVGPSAGGAEAVFKNRELLVITPQSPLGRQVMGKKQGDRFRFEIAGTSDSYRITAVW